MYLVYQSHKNLACNVPQYLTTKYKFIRIQDTIVKICVPHGNMTLFILIRKYL
jgi:hypothetical protein